MPGWARLVVTILCAALLGTIVWERTARLLRPGSNPSAKNRGAAGATAQSAHVEWQDETSSSLEDAAREATAGNITQAEVAVDRAAAFVTAARFKSQSAAPGFFEATVNQLDRIVAIHPENERLSEHAALMRIELAQFRSSLETPPPEASDANRIAIGAPRAIARDAMLDPKSLGGSELDATVMPSSAEILEPPFSRLFVDNVRIENLTLAGAAQTLDGMHWKNVTFVGTRLRYEGGEVDLHNVHFVRCTFGFTTDERGVRLANAIALGQTSLVID
jgi:hypothetical protein